MRERSSRPIPTIIIDTREQEPWAFDREAAATVRRALPAGDYSLVGLETAVAVERKTLDDFVSTVIRHRRRFHRELRRLVSYSAACVVVEAGFRDILEARYRSGASPASVLGSVVSVTVDFGVPVFFCSDRSAARVFAEGYLLRAHRRYVGRCRETETGQ